MSLAAGCASCPDMRPRSDFDGKHLFCERHGVWTNLMDERYRGHCLDSDRSQLSGTVRKVQLPLF